jgi:DNA-binding CsgD family transcriptional regulator
MPSFDAVRLARFYGLTPACGRLLAGLLAGQSLAEYAKVNRLSPNTVKTQLQKIFLETEQVRQSDLIRLVLSDPVVITAARVNRRSP